ncbi:MAG: putative zinc-binding protein [Methanobrevibacter sp.]|nr:putative zinc-binding protein [Methanobrevibacter sp.]
MGEKISIASCSGMSTLGLVGRATCNDLATENENILSICITATAADNDKFSELIKKYPILAINGCSDACVNKILKSKGVDVEKTINIDKIFEEKDLDTNDPSRLDDEGEKAVKKLKKIIITEIDLI